MSNIDDIYMAGLLDGEGTIGIARMASNELRSPYVSVSSTTREIIDWLKETYGGVVSVQKVYQEHHKQAWTWKLRNKGEIKEMLERVLPYMKEPDKIRRGHLLINVYDTVTKRNGKYSEAEMASKLDFEANFLALDKTI